MGSQPMPDRKILILVLDGLGDLPVASLGGNTPLEAAATPRLDRWVAEGQCGLLDPVEPGLTVETHAGTGTVMGLGPRAAADLARGPIEAAGAGIDLLPGDIALRCNFATLVRDGDQLAVLDRRAGRIQEGASELCAAVNAIAPRDGVTTFLAPLSQHRAVLRLSGSRLSAAITDTDPGSSGRTSILRRSTAARAGDTAAERTAAFLDRFLREVFDVLSDHPLNQGRLAQGLPAANGLLTRGAGAVHPVDGLVTRLGLRGAVVAGDRTVLGLGTLLGFTPVTEPAFTAMLDTDLEAKVAAARAALREHDIVWLHVKGTDIAAHDRRPDVKRDFLERLDAALAPLEAEELVLAVTADHTTNSNTGRHTSDPVPTFLRVPGGRRDDVVSFGERACMRGGLGRLRSSQFLRVVLSAAGALEDPRVEVPNAGPKAPRQASDAPADAAPESPAPREDRRG